MELAVREVRLRIPASPKPDRAEQRLNADIEQAWQHHRHLNEKGMKFLDRFITILVATAAFSATVVDKRVAVEALIALSIFIFMAFLCALAILRSYVANGYVLEAYNRYFLEAYAHIYTGGAYPRILSAWDNRPPYVTVGRYSSREFDILVMLVLLLLSGIAQAAIGWLIYTRAHIWLLTSPAFTLAGVMLFFTLWMAWRIDRRKLWTASRSPAGVGDADSRAAKTGA